MWRSCIAAGHKAVRHADPALFSSLLGDHHDEVVPGLVEVEVAVPRLTAALR